MHSRDEVIAFLCRAKRATYAAGKPQDASSRPGSHDLSHREGELLYIDTYLGGERFSGEEAVWDDEAPVWAMNYTGRVTKAGFSGAFLKEALLHTTEALPYRGPLRYENGPFVYTMNVKGGFEWFYGYEEILRDGAQVYECAFHGGIVT